MTITQNIALLYFVILLGAAAINYVPGITDSEGRAFGIFALDIFDDLLHVVSAAWALVGALISRRTARFFLIWFGALYLADGALGLAVGSGYLDLGIVKHGVQDLPIGFKILANLPHIGLGGFALATGLFLDRD